MDKFKKAQLELYKRNFKGLLAKQTKSGSAERFRKREKLKELYLKIRNLESEIMEDKQC